MHSGEYSTAEVADLFGVGRSTVYRAIERQRIAAKAGLAEGHQAFGLGVNVGVDVIPREWHHSTLTRKVTHHPRRRQIEPAPGM